MHSYPIETPQVKLRLLTVDDISERYVRWLNDPSINQFLETRHEEQSSESCHYFVDRCIESPTEHLFGIFNGIDDRHIGNAKLGFINQRYLKGEISLFIGDQKFWGKGIGREVVHALTAFGFAQLGLMKIEAGCYEENIASLRTFLRIGYAIEGFSRSSVVSENKRCGIYRLGIVKAEFNE